MDILTSLHGRRFGLGPKNELIREGEVIDGFRVARITSEQLLALNATPQAVIPAMGAGFAIVPTLVTIRHGGGTAYAGIATGEDLVLKYTDASGTQCSSAIETTGFLDQTTAQIRCAGLPGATGATAGSFTPVANSPIVLHLLTGEITTGNFDLLVRVDYKLIRTDFTA